MAKYDWKKVTVGSILLAVSFFILKEAAAWVLGSGFDWLKGNWKTIPWAQILAFCGLIVGAALLLSSKKSQPKAAPEPSRHEKIIDAFTRGQKLNTAIKRDRNLSWIMRDRSADQMMLASNAESIFLSLHKLGFLVPSWPEGVSTEAYLIATEVYFTALLPLIRDRHFEEAEQTAAEMAPELTSEMRTYERHDWFTRR